MHDDVGRYRMPRGVALYEAEHTIITEPLGPDGRADARLGRIDLPKIHHAVFVEFDDLIRGAWRERRSCMLVLLLLDIDAGAWSVLVPEQTADAEGACASIAPLKPGLLGPSIYVAGSASSVAAPWCPDPAPMVPAFSGLHFVLQPDREPTWRAYLQTRERQRQVRAANYIYGTSRGAPDTPDARGLSQNEPDEKMG